MSIVAVVQVFSASLYKSSEANDTCRELSQSRRNIPERYVPANDETFALS